MFVRTRRVGRRLQLSIVESRRAAARVRNEHFAGLGSVPTRPSVADRVAFWVRLHQRLDALSNRIGQEDAGKILAAVHDRVPMPTADEQHSLQEENAKADDRFWSNLRDMYAEAVESHKSLIRAAERAIADGQTGKAEAEAGAARAKERLKRLNRGEAGARAICGMWPR